MNTKIKERNNLADARQFVKNLSNQEFEEVRNLLGLSHSREELLRSSSAPKLKAKPAAKKK
jgi:hypothetical protein